MRKVAVIFLTAILAFSMIWTGGTSVSAIGEGFGFSIGYNEDFYTVWSYSGSGGAVTIPSQLLGKPVTKLLNVFEERRNVTSVTIPSTITSIDNSAFYDCSALDEIIVDPNNQYFSSADGVLFNKDKSCLIAYPAHKGGDYSIPASVKKINPSAFSKCPNIGTLTIPSTVELLGEGGNAFAFSTGITAFSVDAGNQNYSSENGILFDKAKTAIIRYPVANSSESFTIPTSVSSFYYRAFASSIHLKKVTLPDSVTYLDDYTFNDCTSLTSITIGSVMSSFNINTLMGCSALKEIIVPESNPSLSSLDGVLFNKAKTTLLWYPYAKTGDYTIPTGVTTLSGGSIGSATGLTNLTIPNGVKTISEYLFSNCTSLTSITIPASTTTVNSKFKNCTALKEITVDANNTAYTTENGVLFNKSKTMLLKYPTGKSGSSFTVPSTVTELGGYAFEQSTLESVVLSSGLLKIGEYAFYKCLGLSGLTIPSNVVSIGGYAFQGCNKLTSITIPDSVTVLKYGAFQDCSELTKVNIGSGITFIDWLTFYFCPKLSAVCFSGDAPALDQSGVFRECSPYLKIYYPTGKAGYTDDWYNGTKVEFMPLTIAPVDVTLSAKSGVSVNLSWSGVIGATGYEVYAGASKLAVTDTNSCTINLLSPNTSYEFTVKAINEADESPFSTPLSVTIGDGLPGDINGDGEVNLKDVTFLSRHTAGWQGLLLQPDALDVNADGKKDLMDVTLLSRKVAGWSVTIH